MQRKTFFALLLAAASGSALAGDCTGGLPGTWSHGIIFEDQMICGASASNSDTWQEFHNSNGTLTEYAEGATDPLDPTHNVGSWVKVVSGPAPYFQTRTVTYTYGTNSYTFDVYYRVDGDPSNRPIVFCGSGASTTLVATATRPSGGFQACP